jgi:hypothetical protein
MCARHPAQGTFVRTFRDWSTGKRKRPGRRCGLSPARLPGLLEWTGPPLVECRALAFVSTCSHRPSRLAAWRAMPRVGLDTGFPVSNPWHRFTLTRLPEPSVLAPFGTDLAESSWGGPSSFGSSTTTPLHAPRPKAMCHPSPEGVRSPVTRGCRVCPVVSPHRSPVTGCPAPPNVPAGLRFPPHPRVQWVRSDPTPARSPVAVADSSSLPTSRGSSAARFEVAVNTVRAPIPLRLVSGVGWAEAPSSPPRSTCALRNEHQ